MKLKVDALIKDKEKYWNPSRKKQERMLSLDTFDSVWSLEAKSPWIETKYFQNKHGKLCKK